MPAAVHFAVAPPDGFESWDDAAWGAWLAGQPWEPVTVVAPRGEWLVFLYMARVHGKRSQGDVAPYLERLMTERPFRAREVEPLRRALVALRSELASIPAGRLWTGTQFYTADELHALILRHEEETGKRGQELAIADLWRTLFDALDGVLARAQAADRGVYFGRV